MIIACDTTPSNRLAETLKATFGAKLFTPHASLRVLQKQKIAGKNYAGFRNSHERDAIAAARKAYNHVANKLRQTTARISNGNAEYACRAVLEGKKMADAVSMQLP